MASIIGRVYPLLGCWLLLCVAHQSVPWSVCCADSAAQPGAGADVVHAVTASVEYSTERVTGKQASISPGEFTVPEGFSAYDLRYRWADVKTGRESNRITATTVYSVTQRRYMTELKDNPNPVLPAGKYKLVVGGLPGATGNLTYRLQPAADSSAPNVKSSERIIDVETWQANPQQDYNPKFKATYFVRQGKVTGTRDQTIDPPKYNNGIRCDPMRYKGTFVGRMEGNVIVGKWEEEILPVKMYFPATGPNQPAYERTDSFSLKYEVRVTLNPDGTVSQTCKGNGQTRFVWGANAPREIASKYEAHSFPIEIPGDGIPAPLTGRWKERSASAAAAASTRP